MTPQLVAIEAALIGAASGVSMFIIACILTNWWENRGAKKRWGK